LQPPPSKASPSVFQPTPQAAVVAPSSSSPMTISQAPPPPAPPTIMEKIAAAFSPSPVVQASNPAIQISIAIKATPPPVAAPLVQQLTPKPATPNFFASVLTNKPAQVQTQVSSPVQQISRYQAAQNEIKEQPTPSRGQVKPQQTASQAWQPQQQTNKASLTTQAMPQAKTASIQAGSYDSLIASQVSTQTRSTQRAGRLG